MLGICLTLHESCKNINRVESDKEFWIFDRNVSVRIRQVFILPVACSAHQRPEADDDNDSNLRRRFHDEGRTAKAKLILLTSKPSKPI